MLFTCAAAEEAPVLTALYNPDYPDAVVAEHEPTGDEYFTDAVFIGDSMMEYVELLDELPTANYVWNIGMSPASVAHKQFRVKGSSERLSGFEQTALYQPRKIYILLGSNGLDHYPTSYVVADYEKLADTLITTFPEALIYVIAPPPMSRERMKEEGNIPKGRYANFADELKALAERRHFYYIDLYHMVVDANGYLPDEYDAGDGFHLSNRAYSMLIRQVRMQAVPYPVTTEEGE